MKKKLILESGEVFHGEGFGAELETAGEVVFNTGMTGYQELISDPSYCGQIVCMTYPLIGNYGINRDDYESIEPAIKGLIVKELCDLPSNFRTQITLDELFKKKNLSGISGIDTRRLTRILRNSGVVKGKIVKNALCQPKQRFQSSIGRFRGKTGNHQRIISKKL
jgi:carbamoyl-phosphate synthase small subunit